MLSFHLGVERGANKIVKRTTWTSTQIPVSNHPLIKAEKLVSVSKCQRLSGYWRLRGRRGFIDVAETCFLLVCAGRAAVTKEGQGKGRRHAGEGSRAAHELLPSVRQRQVSTHDTHTHSQGLQSRV